MARWFRFGCALCVVCSLGGCSGRNVKDKPVPVSGTVNVDGKPLDDGSVTLIAEGGAAPDTLPVKDGKFEGQAKPGKKKVEIRAFRLGKKPDMPGADLEATKENYLPARFNTETTLTAEVTASGLTPNNFDTSTKSK